MNRICPVSARAQVAPRRPPERISPVPFHAVIIGAGLVSVVEIQFVSGTRFYSYEGISAPEQWWKDAVISIGEFSREVAVLPGEARVSDASVVMDNSDLEFSKLKDTESFRNTKLVIRHGDSSLGAAGLTTVFTGEIANYNIGQGQCVFSVRDVTYDRFRENLSGAFNRTDFPNMPQERVGQQIPIIMGHNTDVETPPTRGVVPAYLVDPAINQSKYVYVLARHPCKAILDVFHYETRLAEGTYEVATQVFGPYNCQILRFISDMETGGGEGPAITCNVDGSYAYDLVIENPVSQFWHVLVQYLGILADELDLQSFNAVFESLDGLKGAFVIDGSDIAKGEIIARFQTSFNLFLQPTRFGTFGFYTLKLDNEIPLANVTRFNDVEDIMAGTFMITSYPDPISRLIYQYSWQWALSFFSRRPHHIDDAEEVALRRDVRETIDLWYVRDDFTATDTALRRHGYSKQDVQVIRFELPERFFGLELNDHFLLTHREGIAADGDGYQEVRCRITALRHQLQPSSMKVAIDAVVVPPEPPVPLKAGFVFSELWRTRADETISDIEHQPEVAVR
jgi:hypothetical protein